MLAKLPFPSHHPDKLVGELFRGRLLLKGGDVGPHRCFEPLEWF